MKAWDDDVERQERILQRHFRAWDSTPSQSTAPAAARPSSSGISSSFTERWLQQSRSNETESSYESGKSSEEFRAGSAPSSTLGGTRPDRKSSLNNDVARDTIVELRLELRSVKNENEEFKKRVEALEAENTRLKETTERKEREATRDRLVASSPMSPGMSGFGTPGTPASVSSLNSSGSPRSPHTVNPAMHIVGTDGRARKSSMVAKQGRRMSLSTSGVLGDMSCVTCLAPIAARIAQAFRDPEKVASYVNSATFANDIISLCKKVTPIFEAEDRCLRLQAPVYVFGDVHGNLTDLRFFQENVWRLGMELTGGKFVFLGDYVDRGLLGLEVVAYMFSQKAALPHKVFMLRGNHETRSVNGDESWYGQKSFFYQCKSRFGFSLGQEVYEEVNKVFDRLPLACLIDGDIFCVHGGIPRPIPGMTEIEAIETVPHCFDPDASEDGQLVQIVTDCVWSDPATKLQEQELDEEGFGESLRGEDAVCFGTPAIDAFLGRNELSYILRAHTSLTEGIDISKGCRVFTIFSTSKDHGGGPDATCGCVLIDGEQLLVINRTPNYERYTARRRGNLEVADGPPDETDTNISL